MKWFWNRNVQTADAQPAVVRPPCDRPITEFEKARLEHHGKWLTINLQVTPRGSWVNWKHDIPEELREEAKDGLLALAIKLQETG